MTGVFISHRRPTGSAYARRLTQELSAPGSGIEVIPGLDALVPGTDIVAAIEQIVDRADVVLAVIDPDWLSDTDEHGRRRIGLATDTVHIEIATALRRPGPVIPVLVGGAILPQPDELPADIAALARRTPIELRNAAWAGDVERLRAILRPLGAPAAAEDTSRNRLMLAIIAVLVLLVAGLAVAAVLVSRDDDGSPSAGEPSTTTGATTSTAATEATTTAAATSTAGPTTTEQATTTSPPPTTTATTGPDLSAILFEDSLAPPSDVFPAGQGSEGCAFTPGPDGYEIAVATSTACLASGFLDAGALPNAALSVTAALPAGASAPTPTDDVGIALACSATDSSDYLATIGPTGSFDLVRRADVTDASKITSLVSGNAPGIDLAKGALRARVTCTASDAGVRVQVTVGDRRIINAIDPVALPPGRPTFGVARSGEREFAVEFTNLVVNGPAG